MNEHAQKQLNHIIGNAGSSLDKYKRSDFYKYTKPELEKIARDALIANQSLEESLAQKNKYIHALQSQIDILKPESDMWQKWVPYISQINRFNAVQMPEVK